MVLHLKRRVGSASGQPEAGRWRRAALSSCFVLTLAATGAVLPSLLVTASPAAYVSHAVVKVSAPGAGSIDTDRLAASVQQSILSPLSLTLAISDLKLKPGDVMGVAEERRIAMLAKLLLGDVQQQIPVNAIEEALRSSVKITASSKSSIDIDAMAATSQAATRIVDYLAGQVAKTTGGEQASPELQAVEKARAALDAAEGALTGVQMRNGNDIVSRIQNLQQSLHEADATIAALGQKEHDLAQAVTKVSSMKADDVLTKALPPLAPFDALASVRDNYTTAKLALDDVNVDHGPKHPRTIAAQGAVDAARSAAMPALRRALESVKGELKEVSTSLNAQTRQKTAIEDDLRAMGAAPAELAKLEKALDSARRDYLVASQKAGPFAAPAISSVIAKPASPGVLQDQSSGIMNGVMAAGGALSGMLLALFLMSFRRSEAEAQHEIAPQEVVSNTVIIDDASANAETARDQHFQIEPDIFHDIVADDIELHSDDRAYDLEPDEEPDDGLHDEPANDIPLDERVRQVLIANRVRMEKKVEQGDGSWLPPLLAAALEGKAEHIGAETEEVRALRREIAALRQRVNGFAEDDMRRRA